MNIILCGMPMCGKTTIGKLLADKLNYHFVDIDRLIEHAYQSKTGKKATCRQIFQQEGEEEFRALENEQVCTLKSVEKTIIAIGGGALSNKENREAFKTIGILVYFKTPLHDLLKRMSARGIPAYVDANDIENSFAAIAQKRIPEFEAAADLIIDTDQLTKEEIVSEILNRSPVHKNYQEDNYGN